MFPFYFLFKKKMLIVIFYVDFITYYQGRFGLVRKVREALSKEMMIELRSTDE